MAVRRSVMRTHATRGFIHASLTVALLGMVLDVDVDDNVSFFCCVHILMQSLTGRLLV
jgi:hypothetical protein